MKVFITKSYVDFSLSNKQNKYTDIAKKLDVQEMGIPVCKMGEGASYSLSHSMKLLDGMIAPVQSKDLVLIQLPTGNGVEFENRFIQKIIAYARKEPVILWGDETYYLKNKEFLATNLDQYLIKNDLEGFQNILLNCITKHTEKIECFEKKEEDFIHIGFTLQDVQGTSYIRTLAAIESIIENTEQPLYFHIVCDSIASSTLQGNFSDLVEGSGHQLEFNQINSEKFSVIENFNYTKASYLSSFFPMLFSKLKKIIYLDNDIYVNLDIIELWKQDLSNVCLAAVRDTYDGLNPLSCTLNHISSDTYFNSNVLIMNLENIRKYGDLSDALIQYCKNYPQSELPVQDAYNVIFRNSILFIDEKFNQTVYSFKYNSIGKEQAIWYYMHTENKLYDRTKLDFQYNQVLANISDEANCAHYNEEESRLDLFNRKSLLMQFITCLQQNKKEIVFYVNDSFDFNKINKVFGENRNYSYFETLTDEIANQIQNKVIIVDSHADKECSIEKLEQKGFIQGKNYFILSQLFHFREGGFEF